MHKIIKISVMEKMLFEFDYRYDDAFCIVEVYDCDCFVNNCKSVHIEGLWSDYTFSTHMILSTDIIQDVHTLKSHIHKKVTQCLDSFLNQSVVFRRKWNMYCDSVPQVYLFERDSLFTDSKLVKFNCNYKHKHKHKH